MYVKRDKNVVADMVYVGYWSFRAYFFPPQLSTPEVAPDLPYSLLPALSDGYFSDITITSKSGRKVSVSET